MFNSWTVVYKGSLLLQKFIPPNSPTSENQVFTREFFGYSLKIFMGITFIVQQGNTLGGRQEARGVSFYIYIATY